MTPTRYGTVVCRTNKPYLFNNRFQVVRNPQYFVNGELAFPCRDIDVDGTYRTLFGPVYSCNWIVYRKCNHNLKLALRRLFCYLEASPIVDHQLRTAQALFIQLHTQWLVDMFRTRHRTLSTFLSPFDEALEHIHDPHPKKLLREQAFEEMYANGTSADCKGTWASHRTIKAKIKASEKAKPQPANPANGKYPRMIFDIGVDASLLGSWLADRFKVDLAADDIIYKCARIRFVKSPDPFMLRDMFIRFHQPEYPIEFICFSDDASLVIYLNGQRIIINSDISSADASYTPALFELAYDMLPENCKHTMRRLIDQCKMCMKVRSYSNPKISVTFKPLQPVLYSGSTLTTLINTLANILIAMSFADAYDAGCINQPNDLIAIARAAGFIITLDVCEHFEDLQFLKHSPVFDVDGNIHPMLNMGVLLRASGMCMADLPGSGDLRDRAFAFQRGLIQGAYPYANCALLDAMRDVVGSGPVVSKAKDEFKYKVEDSKYPVYRVDEDSFALRYRLTPLELSYLCELSRQHSYCYAIQTSGSIKILQKDYGLGAEEYNRPEFFFNRA